MQYPQNKISIVILTYNRSTLLKDLLLSLQKLRYEPLEIIVIDNYSEDNTEEMIGSAFPNIGYIRTNKNIGVSARNLGLKRATGDIVVTLDDDIIGLDDNGIESLIGLFDKHQDVGAVCFKVVDHYNGQICDWCHQYKIEEYSDRQFVTDDISEGAVAFRRSVLAKSGLYPDNFFISYEGADLLCRILDSGYKTIYSPEVVVHHRHAQQGRPNWRRYYYDTRNQIWFVARNYPVLMGLKYLFRGLTAMFFYSVRDGFLRYWIKGVWDGVRSLPRVLAERKCISKATVVTLRQISTNRPGLFYMIRKRVFQRGIKI